MSEDRVVIHRSVCALCGEEKGHTPRCSVTRHGVDEKRFRMRDDSERPRASVWSVGFDDERVATFRDERSAIEFAHFDSQLEGVTAVVVRHDPDGTATVVAEYFR